MDPIIVGFIGIGFLFVFLFSGMPIGGAMTLIGVAGFAYLTDLEAAYGILKTVPYATFASYNFSIVPLFILMGAFVFKSGLGSDIFDTIYKWVGHFRGGIAQTTVIACACFAAISGSSLATAATLGAVSLPEMKKYKYDDSLATGSIAAGGSIGILIPPSVVLIIYGFIAEQSIGKLFLAGFIPGIMEAFFYLITIWILTTAKPTSGPKGPRFTMRERFRSLRKTWEVLILFLVVIGGIYAGIFTPTEAAGVGAFGAFFFTLARKKLTREVFKDSLLQTCSTSGMIFLILMGAMIFGYFLTVSQVPSAIAELATGLNVSRYVILIAILVVTLALGCVMDSLAIILLTVPVFYPVIVQLGFDPIWFGILVVRVTEMGLITPPVGLNVFIIKGISGAPIQTVFKGVLPFLFADAVQVAILIMVPQIIMFLPDLMG